MIHAGSQLNDDDSELLSAYLDNHLSPEERALLEQRLGQEPALQQTLEELRMTVALVRALPTLSPPRSFAISSAPRRQPVFTLSGLLRYSSAFALVLLVLTVTADVFSTRSRLTASGSPFVP